MTLVLQDNVAWRGTEYFPGEVIPDLTEEETQGLIDRGLLGGGKPSPATEPESVEPTEAEPTEDLSDLNKAQLVALAAERGIEHDSKVTKDELLDLLATEPESVE
jgi:hypothetical protein